MLFQFFCFFFQGANQSCEDLCAIGSFVQGFLGWPKNAVGFRTHGFANLVAFGLPCFIVEHVQERVRYTGVKMLLLAELHELNTSSSTRLTGGRFLLVENHNCRIRSLGRHKDYKIIAFWGSCGDITHRMG